VCVSKHHQGIALFKEISAKESTRFDDNVPSLDYNPGTHDGGRSHANHSVQNYSTAAGQQVGVA
jgi:hypothetical protein